MVIRWGEVLGGIGVSVRVEVGGRVGWDGVPGEGYCDYVMFWPHPCSVGVNHSVYM